MAHHNTVFQQLLDLLPRHEFDAEARQHQKGQRLRVMSRWAQFVALGLGQLAGLQGLAGELGYLPFPRVVLSCRQCAAFLELGDIGPGFWFPSQPVVKVADPAWPGAVECRTFSDMAMGKRAARQASPMWVDTADLPTSDGHPFFERLNRVLEDCGFDAYAELSIGVAMRSSKLWGVGLAPA